MTHGDAITFASIGVMRVKLPALINQITIIGSIVSNEISILVGRVVHARSAIPETFVDIIEVCECVLLSSRPPIIVTAIVVVIVVVVVVIDVVAGGGVSVVKIVAAVVVQVAHIALTAMIVRDAAGIDVEILPATQYIR